MVVSRTAWLTLGTGALLLVGGCQTVGSCRNPLTDADAPEIPPLKMPAGLDGPDTKQSLQIPPLNEPELPRGKDDPCQQEPPPMQEPGSQTPPAVDAPSEAESQPRPRRPVSPPR
jgi:uncharacterized lipoprotein